MRPLVIAATMVAAVSLSACGSASGSKTSSAPTASTAAESTASTPPPPRFATATEQEVAAVAERYTHGIATGDYEAACTTRSTDEQAELARLTGSCARGLRTAVLSKSTQAAWHEFLGEATAGSVSVHGNRAAVGIVQPGQTRPAMILVAGHERVGWRLIEASNAEADKLLKR
jgi:hypothetical protein